MIKTYVRVPVPFFAKSYHRLTRYLNCWSPPNLPDHSVFLQNSVQRFCFVLADILPNGTSLKSFSFVCICRLSSWCLLDPRIAFNTATRPQFFKKMLRTMEMGLFKEIYFLTGAGRHMCHWCHSLYRAAGGHELPGDRKLQYTHLSKYFTPFSWPRPIKRRNT